VTKGSILVTKKVIPVSFTSSFQQSSDKFIKQKIVKNIHCLLNMQLLQLVYNYSCSDYWSSP